MTKRYQNINEYKVLESLVWLSQKLPGIDFHRALKVLFYADKQHLQSYGRPVIGDEYKKMDNGPVGSTAYDLLKRSCFRNDRILEKSKEALDITYQETGRLKKIPCVYAEREPDWDEFSETDIDCLQEALDYCKDKSFGELCDITHEERGWQEAEYNDSIEYELLLEDEDPYKDELIKSIKESASTLVF